MITVVSPVQPENVSGQMSVTPSGIETLVRPLQSEKAESPISVTSPGMV